MFSIDSVYYQRYPAFNLSYNDYTNEVAETTLRHNIRVSGIEFSIYKNAILQMLSEIKKINSQIAKMQSRFQL